ncbi:carboxypeptidase-like regulatory domain-containing protein [Acinetobacter lwoffii]|uniref:carboxypeptidase-like regulatory domain-containing protein n=1 Tax=Acinetobacter lwoffii TaxID=28090 RepID=UPI00209A63E0|nr:carboxypeptidase-like regulatory domain-containing protein [Acinetobacter lwoffii]MCO8084973.1 carboxypeptidase-like regulatory domain-containing protein [Acinetobacter lwoffii]
MFIKTEVSNNQKINEITVNSVFKIKGYLMKQGVPIIGTVHLLSTVSGHVIRISKSNSDGSYEFKGLPKGRYIIFARDKNKQFNAVIQDNVVPK